MKTGKTTRLADKYIQELFTTNFIDVKDHSEDSSQLFTTIVQRLTNEHRGLRFEVIYPNKIKLL